MLLSLQTPAQLFLGALHMVTAQRPAALLGRWQARAAERQAEEAMAGLPSHLLVDIGVRAAADGPTRSKAPVAAVPAVPPASAMQRRGDWGAGSSLLGAGDRAATPSAGPCWTWPAGG